MRTHTHTGGGEDLKAVDDHLRQLRSIKLYEESFIVFGAEANMSWLTSDTISSLISRYPPCTVISSDPVRVGVWTGHQEKMRGWQQTMLLLKANSIGIASNVFGTKPKEHLDLFRQHMERFSLVMTDPEKNVFTAPKITVSGKQHNRADDLATVCILLVYWAGVECSKESFRTTCFLNGYSIMNE
jgi:hypothetical protein